MRVVGEAFSRQLFDWCMWERECKVLCMKRYDGGVDLFIIKMCLMHEALSKPTGREEL